MKKPLTTTTTATNHRFADVRRVRKFRRAKSKDVLHGNKWGFICPKSRQELAPCLRLLSRGVGCQHFIEPVLSVLLYKTITLCEAQ
jgi:hypothetical protein